MAKRINTEDAENAEATEKRREENDHAALGREEDGGRTRISPQPLLKGKIFPGLREASGLKASWTRRMRSKSASEKRSGISSDFSMPTPCSPVSAPPTSTQ